MEQSSLINRICNLSPEKAFKTIEEHWTGWDSSVKPSAYVIGISGGVDSTCVAALACKIFGREKVMGVSLPCDGQKDIDDVNQVFEHLGIRRADIDIGDAVHALKTGIENNAVNLTEQCIINMPARVRMAALFGVAQCLDAVVLNTCNRSETVCGYDTLFGDSCGCYAPVKNLTKTEVMDLAAWLGVPRNLAYKTPVDGLQPLTDEQKLGFTYKELDTFIRNAGDVLEKTASKIKILYSKNKFKSEIINVPGPDFNFLPDVFRAGLYV